MTETSAVLYLRFSKEDAGDSIAAQRDTCTEWAERQGISVTGEYSEDATSAFRKRMTERAAWAALEADVRAGKVTHVVARHIDRLTRSMLDLEHLVRLVEDTGVRLLTVWSSDLDLNSPAGRQTARILASVAQGESETKAQRIQAQKARARAQGRSTGGPRPFGYMSLSGDVEPAEAALVRDGIDMALAGRSLHAITAHFAASGVPTSRGGSWHKKTVRDVLVRWRNAGRVEHRGEDFGPATWPSIIDLDTLRAVRAVLLDPARRQATQRAGGPVPTTLGSGLLTCGQCGGTLKARTAPTGPQGQRQGVYTCTGSGCSLTIARDLADREISSAMARLYLLADVSDVAPDADARAALIDLQREAAELAEERRDVLQMVKDGVLRASESRELLAGVGERQDALETALNGVQARLSASMVLARPITQSGQVDMGAVLDFGQRWDAQPLDVRRQQVAAAWTVMVHRRHRAAGLGLKESDKQSARFVFSSRIRESLSYDNLDEITQQN